MIKYKLTDKNMRTYNGFQWELGKEYTIEKKGNTLCTDEVFHFYDDPRLAVIFNSIHANYKNPLLFKCKCDEVIHDGLKGGSKKMKLIEQMELPKINLNQKIAFGIKCALHIYFDKSFVKWADNWLSGKNRSAAAAAEVYAAATADAAAEYSATAAWVYAVATAAERDDVQINFIEIIDKIQKEGDLYV
jgi:hypothetical protein